MNNVKGALPFTQENIDNVFVRRIKTQTIAYTFEVVE